MKKSKRTPYLAQNLRRRNKQRLVSAFNTRAKLKQALSAPVSESKELTLNPIANNIIRTVGGLGSSLLGLGHDFGDNLGNSAHKLFKQVTGYGDYQVKSNTLMSGGPPMFKPSDRILHLRHREFVTDIFSGTMPGGVTSTIFTNTTSLIQPNNSRLFPWLSTICKNFQQYRFRGLIFTYESKSGNAISSTNAALGSVMLATNYNIAAPAFANKQEMETHEFTSVCKPSDNMIHPIECSPKEQVCQHFYVQNRELLPGEDPKFYHVGKLNIATIGQQAAGVNLGELWVSYDIELLKPRKDQTTFAAHYQISGNLDTKPLGDVNVMKYGQAEVISIDQPGNVITISSSFYGLLRLTAVTFSPLVQVVASIADNSIVTTIPGSSTFVKDTYHKLAATNSDVDVSVFEYKVSAGGNINFTVPVLGAPDANATIDLFFESIRQDDLN